MDLQDKNIANEDQQSEEEAAAWMIKSIADNANPPLSPTPRIPRVPTSSMVTETTDYNKYYVPKVVSIGPYHSRNPNLKFAENLKPGFAKKILSPNWEIWLPSLYKKLGEPAMVQSFRNFYQEKSTVDFSNKAFTKMMIFDACFILYYIIYIYSEAKSCPLNRHQIVSVHQDLFLLENQIPFQVLIELASWTNLIHRHVQIDAFFRDNFLVSGRPKQGWLFAARHRGPSFSLEVEVDHLLQFLHHNLVTAKRSRSYKATNESHRCIVRNANDLIDVGIKFKPSRSMSLSEIGFYRSWWFFSAKLVLPPIVIEASTKPMLLNLIAHEMCSDEGREAWVTSYVCFLHSLVNKSEDVDVLRKAGVLDHSLGSDNEVVKMLNEIGADLMPNIAAYSEVKNKLQHHYESWRDTPISKVKRDYMKSPWVFAFLGAVIALFLSGVQTYFTVWSPKGECDDLCKFLKINHHL